LIPPLITTLVPAGMKLRMDEQPERPVRERG
jgi:hypothetical protein